MEMIEDKFSVKTFECQVDGNIKIVSLMQHLQEVAALHAEQLGLGFIKLNEKHAYWILTNIRIEINKFPRWNDEVTVRTWPSGYTRLIATREFVGVDQNEFELFRASSQWMVLDKQNGRPKNLFHLDLNLPKTGSKAISEQLTRLEPQDSYSEIGRICVPYSSIDLNGHVNNTEYVRWGIDALRKVLNLKKTIDFVHATYLSEVFEGDELDLLVSRNNKGHFSILERRSGRGNNVHIMEIGCQTT